MSSASRNAGRGGFAGFGPPLAVAILGIAGCGSLAAWRFGAGSGVSAALGAAGASAVQLLSLAAIESGLRSRGAVELLRALGRSAALRLFGGAIVVSLAVGARVVDPAPFLTGFGLLYVALEIVVDLRLLKHESPGFQDAPVRRDGAGGATPREE